MEGKKLNLQTKIRLQKMKELAGNKKKILEIGIVNHRLFEHSKTLDCVKEYK